MRPSYLGHNGYLLHFLGKMEMLGEGYLGQRRAKFQLAPLQAIMPPKPPKKAKKQPVPSTRRLRSRVSD